MPAKLERLIRHMTPQMEYDLGRQWANLTTAKGWKRRVWRDLHDFGQSVIPHKRAADKPAKRTANRARQNLLRRPIFTYEEGAPPLCPGTC